MSLAVGGLESPIEGIGTVKFHTSKFSAVNGLPNLRNEKLKCENCKLAKSKRVSFKPIGRIRSTKPLQLSHMDVCDPLPVKSRGGAKYFLSITNDFSRMVICFPLQENFQVFEYFKTFQANAERVLNRKIISGRCDNGIEFCHNKFSKCLNDQGISCEETNTYSAEQNGVSERFNLTAMDCVEAMLNEGGVGKCFGGRGIEFRVKEPLTSYDYDDDSNDSNRPEKTTISDDLDQGSPNFPALGPYCLLQIFSKFKYPHASLPIAKVVVLSKLDCPSNDVDLTEMSKFPYRHLLGCISSIAARTRS
ncbi:retrovirus-related Pol polyprotein from transposon TNT 1-94 [Caerostris darwini]|uniref:Retrovirus-related Pol polyprotein from transposon TNT 1-94 n=1 Tax=Caerostris darwini TaxID=1538125 RepID=A0AAV4TWW0_9ARAC|nr:retrovirus-related Pol polyprotein from transposon TNT 1-94 [Caerostris darwini]